MTPRLRILSIGLALSLTYAIYDYIDRNSNKKPVIEKKKVLKKRPKSARVSLTRAENLKRRGQERSDKKDKKDKIIPQEDFLPISDDISMLEGWSRNPFVEVYKPPSISQKITDQTIHKLTNKKEISFSIQTAKYNVILHADKYNNKQPHSMMRLVIFGWY